MGWRNNIFLVFVAAICWSCSVQIAARPTNIDYNKTKTISIATFFNDANNGPPDISQTFTEKLKDYYLTNSKLELIEANADMRLDGVITGYSIRPVAPTANSSNLEVAALSRLTITVKANFLNTKSVKKEDSFQGQSFTFNQDYDNSESLSDVEDELVDEILDQIVLKIFTRSFDNW